MTISREQLLSLLLLLAIGSFLTVIFLAISFLLATILDDRGKGLAIPSVWLFSWSIPELYLIGSLEPVLESP